MNSPPPHQCDLQGQRRTDCGINEQTLCEAAGCCWVPDNRVSPAYPWCFSPRKAQCSEYRASLLESSDRRIVADLVLEGESCEDYGPDVPRLRLEVGFESKSRLHIKMTDAGSERWEVPEAVLPRPGQTVFTEEPEYEFSYEEYPFSFAVKRRGSGEVLFDTASTGNFRNVLFEEQYLELSSRLHPDEFIFGLGERKREFNLGRDDDTYAFWVTPGPGPNPNTHPYPNHEPLTLFLTSTPTLTLTLQKRRLTF
jgi:alpha-glucosidase